MPPEFGLLVLAFVLIYMVALVARGDKKMKFRFRIWHWLYLVLCLGLWGVFYQLMLSHTVERFAPAMHADLVDKSWR